MTDHQELKRLAEALIKENSCAAANAFENALGPEEVLALLAEIDQLRSAPIEDLYCCNLCQCMIQPVNKLKAEVEALRKDSERLKGSTAFVKRLCDSAGKQPSVATGYLHDILVAMSKEAGNGQAT